MQLRNRPPYTSFVAVGDSFTEGMSDLPPRRLLPRLGGSARRPARGPRRRASGTRISPCAESSSGRSSTSRSTSAAAMGADVVTLVGGLNDTLRPKCDMGRVRGLLEEAVERSRRRCGQLVLMRSPGRNGPVLERFRPRMEAAVRLHRRAGRTARRAGRGPVRRRSAGRSAAVGRRPAASDGRGAPPGRRGRLADAWAMPAEDDWRSPLPPPAVPPGWAARRARGPALRARAPGAVDRAPADGPLLAATARLGRSGPSCCRRWPASDSRSSTRARRWPAQTASRIWARDCCKPRIPNVLAGRYASAGAGRPVVPRAEGDAGAAAVARGAAGSEGPRDRGARGRRSPTTSGCSTQVDLALDRRAREGHPARCEGPHRGVQRPRRATSTCTRA